MRLGGNRLSRSCARWWGKNAAHAGALPPASPTPQVASRFSPSAGGGKGPGMAENQQLFRAVLADPDDDDPRLRYAQWLEAQGDPRGEFILVQGELARTP